MSMYVTTNDGEAAMRYDRAKGEFMASVMKPSRRELCNGEEHHAFTLLDQNTIETVRILSRQEVERDRPDLVEYYYGSGNGAANGYLPCESTGIDSLIPDPHDVHASILSKLSKDDYTIVQECSWRIDVLCTFEHFVDILNRHVRDMVEAQEKLDAWEAAYVDKP